jgi:hypothetical protein
MDIVISCPVMRRAFVLPAWYLDLHWSLVVSIGLKFTAGSSSLYSGVPRPAPLASLYDPFFLVPKHLNCLRISGVLLTSSGSGVTVGADKVGIPVIMLHWLMWLTTDRCGPRRVLTKLGFGTFD